MDDQPPSFIETSPESLARPSGLLHSGSKRVDRGVSRGATVAHSASSLRGLDGDVLGHRPDVAAGRRSSCHFGWRRRRATVRGRRTYRCGASELVSLAEDAQDLTGWSGRAWCEDAAIAFPPQRLARRLESEPLGARWPRLGKVEQGQLLPGREVSDLIDVDLPSPQFAWHLPVGRDRELGQGPIPLGPSGLLAVSEVERAYGLAALPTPVAGRIGAEEWIGGVRYLTPPHAVDGDGGDVHLGGR
jgi:hypothetical protein